MKRTAAKVIPGAPHDVLLVLDATTGQNGLAQAREFTSVVGVTGIILTKLDGTAKGGVVVAISRELGLPVRYVGVGEKASELLPFNAQNFVDSLFSAECAPPCKTSSTCARRWIWPAREQRWHRPIRACAQ